jgi:thiol-disulfide isomerase/thioredoxin
MSTPAADAPKPLARRLLGWLREIGITLVLALVLVQVVGRLRAPPLPEAPYPFHATTLTGEAVSLDQYAGRTVVLNFWATWRPPCRLEIPSFSTFAENNPDIVVLGVSADGTRGELRAAAKQLDISYPVLLPDRAHNEAYGVTTLPTTIVISPEGEVTAIHVGMLTRPQLWWMTR